jgi:hypothetical protein
MARTSLRATYSQPNYGQGCLIGVIIFVIVAFSFLAAPFFFQPDRKMDNGPAVPVCDSRLEKC